MEHGSRARAKILQKLCIRLLGASGQQLRFNVVRERRRRGNGSQQARARDDIRHVLRGCERVRLNGGSIEGVRRADLNVAAARGPAGIEG